MGNTPVVIARWGIRLGFVAAAILAFTVMLNYIFELLLVTLNGNVLTDIFAMIQVWLPFDLNVILLWFTTAVVFYVGYLLTVQAFKFIDMLIKD